MENTQYFIIQQPQQAYLTYQFMTTASSSLDHSRKISSHLTLLHENEVIISSSRDRFPCPLMKLQENLTGCCVSVLHSICFIFLAGLASSNFSLLFKPRVISSLSISAPVLDRTPSSEFLLFLRLFPAYNPNFRFGQTSVVQSETNPNFRFGQTLIVQSEEKHILQG